MCAKDESANPKAKAKEAVVALGANVIKVNDGLVYAVKGGMKGNRKRKKPIAKAAMATISNALSNGQPSKPDAITMICEVKTLAEKAGGYEKLKELVNALAE